MKIQETWI